MTDRARFVCHAGLGLLGFLKYCAGLAPSMPRQNATFPVGMQSLHGGLITANGTTFPGGYLRRVGGTPIAMLAMTNPASCHLVNACGKFCADAHSGPPNSAGRTFDSTPIKNAVLIPKVKRPMIAQNVATIRAFSARTTSP